MKRPAVRARGLARTTIKELAGFVVRAVGLGVLARRTWTRRSVAIVLYHDPSPRRLDAHLRYLGSTYKLIDVNCLQAALASGDWANVPDNAVLLTFDDGFAGNADLAPILERHGARPLIYVCPAVIEGNGRFWFKTPGVDPEPLKLVGTAERATVIEAADKRAPASRRDALRPEELRALSTLADIGSHTLTHPILPFCSDEEARTEIVASREHVTRLTGLPCAHFSYPNGDYTDRDSDLVRAAGYATARTAEAGWNRPGCDPFRLRIASPADHCGVNALAADLAGMFYVRRRRKDAARRRQFSSWNL